MWESGGIASFAASPWQNPNGGSEGKACEKF